MFIPLGLETTGPRRRPYVSIGLAAVSILFFVFGLSQADPQAAPFKRLLTTWIEHPYLVAPEALEKRINADFVSQIAELGALTTVDPAIVYEHQVELDEASAAVLEAEPGTFALIWGLVPARGLAQVGWLTSMFIHFGFAHIFFNLLFFFIVAPALEDRWGHLRFLLFYLAAGIVSSACHVALDPESLAPLGGASGAVAACLGAAAFAFALHRVKMIFLLVFWRRFRVPVWLWSAFWFVGELSSLTDPDGGGTVAVMAHIGGWLFGFAFAAVMSFVAPEKAELRLPTLAVGALVVMLGGAIAIAAVSGRGRDRLTGEILIVSTPPEARIYINDKLIDETTPFNLGDVRFGRATRVAVAARGHRGVPHVRHIVLRESQRAQQATFDLIATHTIEVTSTPVGAAVIVQGRQVGLTPLKTPALDLGHSVDIEVVLRDHLPVKKTLTVASDTPPIHVQLEPSKRLYIESTPSGATVRVDGREVGTSPLDVDVPTKRKFELRITSAGYTSLVRRMRALSKQDSASFTLAPLPIGKLPLDGDEREHFTRLRRDAQGIESALRRAEQRLRSTSRQPPHADGSIYERVGASNDGDDLRAEVERLTEARSAIREELESIRLSAIERLRNP